MAYTRQSRGGAWLAYVVGGLVVALAVILWALSSRRVEAPTPRAVDVEVNLPRLPEAPRLPDSPITPPVEPPSPPSAPALPTPPTT